MPPSAPIGARGHLWTIVLLAALAAATASWAGGEAAHRRFLVARGADFPVAVRGNQDLSGKYLKSSYRVDQARLASASYGLLGGALGLVLGLAGGLWARTPGAATRAAAAGLILGAASGVAAPRGLVPLYFRALDGVSEVAESSDVLWALGTHASIWAALGAAGGLALGLGLGGGARVAVRTIVGGGLGGVLAAVVYEVIGALAFPTARSGLPVADIATLRALSHFIPALAVAAAATLATSPSSRPAARLIN